MPKYPQDSSSSMSSNPSRQLAGSKRECKHRETATTLECLYATGWNNRVEQVSQQYKECQKENKGLKSRPPTSSKYLAGICPKTIERDAHLQATETQYQYLAAQARQRHESERKSIEAMYWEGRDQARQRLLGSIEERRRKLREEKEGGDVVSETLLEAPTHSRPQRVSFRSRVEQRSSLGSPDSVGTTTPSCDTQSGNDLMLHSTLAPALAIVNTDDILSPDSLSLSVLPPPNGYVNAPVAGSAGKRGPRGKPNELEKDVGVAPGASTALALPGGQAPVSSQVTGGRRGAGAQSGWVLGKALNEMRKIEEASQLERDSDWARIQGSNASRARRSRGD